MSLPNSRAWELAVFNAVGLDKVEKAILHALLPFLTWETGEARLSMSALMKGTGWSRRALQGAAQRLVKRGVVSYPHGRAGGRAANGENIVPTWRVNSDALDALGAREDGARDDTKGRTPCTPRGAPDDAKGRTGRHIGAHATTVGGAPAAPNRTLKQENEGNGAHPTTGWLNTGAIEHGLKETA